MGLDKNDAKIKRLVYPHCFVLSVAGIYRGWIITDPKRDKFEHKAVVIAAFTY